MDIVWGEYMFPRFIRSGGTAAEMKGEVIKDLAEMDIDGESVEKAQANLALLKSIKI